MLNKNDSKNTANRLAKEKSPYLLQHAHNPVDWFPWGEEAFAKAKAENKPIFLSIGYSTCHWCHVMEHESFEDVTIASILNDHFVAIKVDREERPDIDGIYMAAVQAMTGQGGWPLSVFLTPERKPFYGGTYFPPEARWGSPGFPDLLFSVNNAWTTNREKILSSSHELSELLKQRGSAQSLSQHMLDKEIFEKAFGEFLNSYDARFGGFGHSPKFPASHNLSFLLRYWQRADSQEAISIVIHTLTEMSNGGMYDQLGGGFHRYSTDQRWQVPHFEKMLYDQAMLVKTYTEAFQATGREQFSRIICETLDYVLRDMTSPEGGFYSAEDADSLDVQDQSGHKKEGVFYVLSFEEIKSVLSDLEAKVFNHYFGIQPNGNAEVDPHGEFIGKNIIAVSNDFKQTAEHFQLSEEKVWAVLKESKEKLFSARHKRPRPHLDDKILTDWNGLMISSFAFASRALHKEKYLQAAQQGVKFILDHLQDKRGRLLHRYREREAAVVGNLEDYAFFIQALLDVYEATFDIIYLENALRLANQMLDLFWDEKAHGFFFTAKDAEELIFRQKELYDGAIPSGNSIATLVLLRLYHMTFDGKWRTTAEHTLRAFTKTIQERPSAYAQIVSAFDFFVGPVKEIVVAECKKGDVQQFADIIFSKFLPNKVLMQRPFSESSLKTMIGLSPFIENQVPQNDQTTVYVCQNSVCLKPVVTEESLKEILTN